MSKKRISIAILLAILTALTACSRTDTIGNTAITSFDAVLNTIPDKIEGSGEGGGWSLISPSGGERFVWSSDYSVTSPYDVMLEFDAKPFIDAGLDVNKLPPEMHAGDKITVGKSLGDDKITYSKEVTPLASFEKIVKQNGDNIKYHAALDHFGVDLGGGNMFEWAKDMDKNDKDIVFVLSPQVFIDSGVDPSRVKGWVFAKVETMDDSGKKVVADKFLKPFDLK